ncbi:restriction endonuclease [Corynebacterium lubricantis]|uniref:restriction endonuclease n=1 Tax=Corynebacterium lubricantis TaxID=541095 RepID=UPI000365D8A1|nr:restriction endonuclease [Corynebacterium lubricantis]
MTGESNAASFTQQGMPTHQQLVVPIVRAIGELGGSAKAREITDQVLDNYPDVERLLEMTYPSRPNQSVLIDRIAWGRSTAKLIGALEQPSKGMYITTDLGEELLGVSEDEALQRIRDLDREYSRQQRRKKSDKIQPPSPAETDEEEPSEEVLAETDTEDDDSTATWKVQLLDRLHRLTPEGFEKFVLYLLRRYGLELTHIGGSGDEGIDGIGTAPLSPVLSSRVAVQVKRYAPNGKPIGRDTVALFQRDAQTKGAERAILVTLSRFTDPARKAATSSTPTVDLISGDRLADLIRDDGNSGVSLQPTVNENWFNKFD